MKRPQALGELAQSYSSSAKTLQAVSTRLRRPVVNRHDFTLLNLIPPQAAEVGSINR